MDRLGVFGGTFDPPHFGHLALAEAALTQLELDKVLWVVAGQSPLKLDRQISPAAVRTRMVAAAIAGRPAFELSRVDLDRPPPHYTVDTLRLLRKQHPRCQLFFIMGQDSLRDLPRWKRPAGIIRQARLAVARRPGARLNLKALEAGIPGLTERICWLDAPPLDIASSDIQERIRLRQTVRSQLPQPVLEIVVKQKLYKADRPR